MPQRKEMAVLGQVTHKVRELDDKAMVVADELFECQKGMAKERE